MKLHYTTSKKLIIAALIFLITGATYAQSTNKDSRFLDNVRFGGGLGFNFGTGFLSFSVAPSAIYDFNEYFSAGPGLIYSYQRDDIFKSSFYGGSIIGLFNPVQRVQLSTEIEQVRVNQTLQTQEGSIENDFWNTALFLGAGYRTGNITAGLRYNVLFKDGESVYASAYTPFVRVFF